MEERGIRPYEQETAAAALAQKQRELADYQLKCEELTVACEKLADEVEQGRRERDQKEARIRHLESRLAEESRERTNAESRCQRMNEQVSPMFFTMAREYNSLSVEAHRTQQAREVLSAHNQRLVDRLDRNTSYCLAFANIFLAEYIEGSPPDLQAVERPDRQRSALVIKPPLQSEEDPFEEDLTKEFD